MYMAFIHSLHRHLLKARYTLVTVLSTGITKVNKTHGPFACGAYKIVRKMDKQN
jgi:hypothetical protein